MGLGTWEGGSKCQWTGDLRMLEPAGSNVFENLTRCRLELVR